MTTPRGLAILPVSTATYDEIAQGLHELGCNHSVTMDRLGRVLLDTEGVMLARKDAT